MDLEWSLKGLRAFLSLRGLMKILQDERALLFSVLLRRAPRPSRLRGAPCSPARKLARGRAATRLAMTKCRLVLSCLGGQWGGFETSFATRQRRFWCLLVLEMNGNDVR